MWLPGSAMSKRHPPLFGALDDAGEPEWQLAVKRSDEELDDENELEEIWMDKRRKRQGAPLPSQALVAPAQSEPESLTPPPQQASPISPPSFRWRHHPTPLALHPTPLRSQSHSVSPLNISQQLPTAAQEAHRMQIHRTVSAPMFDVSTRKPSVTFDAQKHFAFPYRYDPRQHYEHFEQARYPATIPQSISAPEPTLGQSSCGLMNQDADSLDVFDESGVEDDAYCAATSQSQPGEPTSFPHMTSGAFAQFPPGTKS
eukprot:m.13085 g.13085  ORF g.13085 m.13085 type:complete len:257 (-) comp5898_c0_seq2:654-1424(-)